MTFVSLIFVFSFALSFGALTGRSGEPFAVVGYLPDYRFSSWAGDLGPTTDLVYFGLSAPQNGVFDASVIDESERVRLREIKQRGRIRLLLTIGGWEKSQRFAALASDKQLTADFVRDAKAFCIKNGFDGIDYDWEHPSGATQLADYADLICTTSTDFHRSGLLVTVAQAGWQDLGQSTYRCVDRIHLMSYDHDFPQATLAKAIADVKRVFDAGCPAEKICLGIPFYGRDATGATKSYAELVGEGESQSDPSITEGYAFNSIELVKEKVAYAKEVGLGGVMIWELSQDASGVKSLLRAINSH